MQRKARPVALILFVLVLAVAWYLESHQADRLPQGGPDVAGALEKAIARHRSGVWVEGEGTIVYLLPDDRTGDRHQLCLVELASGHTIKISHNVDLAPKVPWKMADRLAFRGRFEWNPKGGVVHWTHHDPDGRRDGGWLRLEGKTYR